MSIGQCQKNGNGEVAGTNLGKDRATALENQQAWGDSSVCQDNNGDYYVLHGAVDLAIKADASPDDLRKKVVSLKSQSDDMASDISGLRVQIEKDKSTLAELGKSQGWFSKLLHDPVSGFFVEAGTVALAFGLVTSMAEDALSLSMLNNAASRDLALQKLKNQYLQSLGGCAAPIRGQQAKLDVKRAAIGAGVVGGVVAANSLLRGNGGDSAGQAPAVENSQPLPDLSSMSDADLKKLYQTLLSNYEAMGKTKAELVTQKTSLESEIIKKGGTVEKETPLDSVMGNRTVRLMADAAAAFGIGSTLIRSRYQTYFKFHDKVEEGLRALDAQAKAQAVNEIAAGKCAAEPATAAEPVKATAKAPKTSLHYEASPDGVVSGEAVVGQGNDTVITPLPEFDDPWADDEAPTGVWEPLPGGWITGAEPAFCPMPTATINGYAINAFAQPNLAGGAWYTYDDGVSTQIVDAATYQRLTTPPPVSVSEADLQTFTEADYQPYLRYLRPDVSSQALTHLPQELAFFYQDAKSPYEYETPLEDIQERIPDLVSSAYSHVAPAEVIKSDVAQISQIYSSPYSVWKMNSLRWALKEYMQGLESGFRPDVSSLVKLGGEDGVVLRYFEIKEMQRSSEGEGAPNFTFAQASTYYVEDHKLMAYNQAHAAELAEESEYRAWKRAADITDARISAFNEANAGFAWKVTLMTVTGQGVYELPATAAVPATAEAGAGWGWGNFAGAGAI